MAVCSKTEYLSLDEAVKDINEKKNKGFTINDILKNSLERAKYIDDTPGVLTLSIKFATRIQARQVAVMSNEEHTNIYEEKGKTLGRKGELDFISEIFLMPGSNSAHWAVTKHPENKEERFTTSTLNEVSDPELDFVFDLPMIGSEFHEIKRLQNGCGVRENYSDAGFMIQNPGDKTFYQLLDSSEKPQLRHSIPSDAKLVVRKTVLEHFVKSLKKNKNIGKESENNDDSSPWKIKAPDDPEPKYDWYTPARYFARVLVRQNPSLVLRRGELAKQVSAAMAQVKVFKRGGIKPFEAGTILKAFHKITFDWIY